MGQRHRSYLDEVEEELCDKTCRSLKQDVAEFEKFVQDNENKQDRLAELEAVIREWFIVNKKAPTYECDSWFELQIGSMYRQKYLSVFDIKSIHNREHIVTATGRTTREIFDKAFRFFTCKDKRDKSSTGVANESIS